MGGNSGIRIDPVVSQPSNCCLWGTTLDVATRTSPSACTTYLIDEFVASVLSEPSFSPIIPMLNAVRKRDGEIDVE